MTGELLLDSSKLAWHSDRVAAWESGERIGPVTVDLALTRACPSSCVFCFAMLQEGMDRENITEQHALNLLDDFAELGVRGASLISDGESTLSPVYARFIEHASSLGIDTGNATNGWLFTPELAERVLPHMSWIRFTVASGTPSGYSDIMHTGPKHTEWFWRAMRNISEAVQIKRKKKLDVTIGIQMVLMPDWKDEIIPFAQLALDLGADYGVIKHCSDDNGSLGVDYDAYEPLFDTLHQAEAMSTEDTQIIVKWQKIRDGNKPSYQRWYSGPFFLQFSGSGLAAPTGMFFSSRYAKWWLGSYTQERFMDIWKSDRYWEVMNALASPKFDAGRMAGSLPIQHYCNVDLDNHVKGIDRITRPSGPEPLHVSFL